MEMLFSFSSLYIDYETTLEWCLSIYFNRQQHLSKLYGKVSVSWKSALEHELVTKFIINVFFFLFCLKSLRYVYTQTLIIMQKKFYIIYVYIYKRNSSH